LDWIETMAEESLFVRLGGEVGIARVLDRHYERVMEDDHLREYFLDVDIGRLKTAQLAFLGAVFGEPGASYDGAALRAAHRDQLVSELAFDSFIDRLIATAAEFGAGAADQGVMREVLNQFRDSVIMRFKPNPAFNYPTKPL
jgi:truncated hemoglobin YjbI